MKKELANKSEIKLVGLAARTNNKNEMDPQTSKIEELAGRFWSQNVAGQLPNRKNPGVTLSIYTEYDSNEHGDYTYFIGEEVNSFENVSADFHKLTMAHQTGEWQHEECEPIKIKTYGRPAVSLFRYGLDYLIEAIISMACKNDLFANCLARVRLPEAQLPMREPCL